jgi:hypothetical protein
MRSPTWEDAFRNELEAARREQDAGRLAQAWNHLERAHVLSQPYAVPHVQVHGRMFGFAWRARIWREVLGQIPRLFLAGPGSLFGRAPLGNTGGANVGIFTPMPIPEDLAALLRTSQA